MVEHARSRSGPSHAQSGCTASAGASRRLWRMKWKKRAVVGIASVIRGISSRLMCSTGSSPKRTRTRRPGSQPSWTANRITSRIPSQNWGMTNPTVESWPVTVEKTRFPRRTETDGEEGGERQRDQQRRRARTRATARSAPRPPAATAPPPSCVAEVALDRFPEPDLELHGQRLVEPEARCAPASTSSLPLLDVRSSRLPTRISAASPGRADGDRERDHGDREQDADQREHGREKAHQESRRRGTRCPPPPFVASVAART